MLCSWHLSLILEHTHHKETSHQRVLPIDLTLIFWDLAILDLHNEFGDHPGHLFTAMLLYSHCLARLPELTVGFDCITLLQRLKTNAGRGYGRGASHRRACGLCTSSRKKSECGIH